LRAAGAAVPGNLPQRLVGEADFGGGQGQQKFARPEAAAQHAVKRAPGERI
jgi:hypothetical protein